MPNITGFVAKKYTAAQKQHLIKLVDDAILESYELPADQKCFILMEADAEYANSVAKKEAFVIVWTGVGRSVAQKRKITLCLTQAFREFDPTLENVVVIIKEHDEVNCGIDGIAKVDMQVHQ